MHCSPDLGDHPYDCDFELFIRNLFISISLRSILGFYFTLLFGKYSPVSSFSLTFCVIFCPLVKTVTSFSLDRLALCRRWSSSINHTRIPACLSKLYLNFYLCSQWLPVVEVFPGLVSIPTVWRMLILMPAQILRGYKLPASSAPWCRLIGSLTFRQCLGKSGHQICTLGTMGERGLRAVFSLLPCAESEGIVSKSAYTTK